MSTSSAAGLRRCVVCAQPVSPKKLVLVRDDRPAHRACRPVTGVPVRVAAEAAAAAAARKPKPPKPMSRTEMLRRIDELRRRDARKAAEQGRGKAGAVGGGRGAKSAKSAKSAGGGRGVAKPAKSVKNVPGPRVGGSGEAGPQPYYGVEMKSVGGRWVQMHPDSE
ncbi:hypothetical protein [Streptomyces sp. CB02009]|uniref:hypothetical protein n=1 Tax=Streptomyces sp. CB02009 TaxID=1703938 RepID=UPI00093AE181|nr:hypothetical protein [Streptomyces sp. CB02009]